MVMKTQQQLLTSDKIGCLTYFIKNVEEETDAVILQAFLMKAIKVAIASSLTDVSFNVTDYSETVVRKVLKKFIKYEYKAQLMEYPSGIYIRVEL